MTVLKLDTDLSWNRDYSQIFTNSHVANTIPYKCNHSRYFTDCSKDCLLIDSFQMQAGSIPGVQWSQSTGLIQDQQQGEPKKKHIKNDSVTNYQA